MKVLLDTNIIIHKEASSIINADIGYMYNWLEKLKATRCIHPVTLEELNRYLHESLNTTLSGPENIAAGYHLIAPESPLGEKIRIISKDIDSSDFDINDTRVLNEVYAGGVDYLISEDEKTHAKARLLDISGRVLTIAAFLKLAASGETGPVDHDLLPVSMQHPDDADLEETFYDTMRRDFRRWDEWYNKTSVRRMGLYAAFKVSDATLQSWEIFLKKMFDNPFTHWLERVLYRYF